MAARQRSNKVDHFGIERCSVAVDPRLAVAQAAGLGSILSSASGVHTCAIGLGNFDDGGPSLRVAVMAGTGAITVHGPVMRESIRANYQNVQFRFLTSAQKGWLRTMQQPQGQSDLSLLDVVGPIPRIDPLYSNSNVLWMSGFLSGCQRLLDGADASAGSTRAGIALLFRRAVLDTNKSVAGDGLGNHPLETIWHLADESSDAQRTTITESHAQRNTTTRSMVNLAKEDLRDKKVLEQRGKRGEKDNLKYSQVTEESSSINPHRDVVIREERPSNHHSWSHDRRSRALGQLDECVRTGAWWVSIRAFGSNDSLAHRVATLYWTLVSSVGHASRDSVGLISRPFQQASSSPGVMPWTDSVLAGGQSASVASDSGALKLVLVRLRRQGIDLQGASFRDEDPGSLLGGRLAQSLQAMTRPGPFEVLVSGERLPTLFQLPAESTPGVEVRRGYDYTSLPIGRRGLSDADRLVRIGVHLPGGIETRDLPPMESRSPNPSLPPGPTTSLTAHVLASDVVKHVLVVGATGSGKTTTVVSLLRSLSQAAGSRVRVAVLEGAKREYQHHSGAFGLTEAGRFDLIDNYLELNIMEHPHWVSPESHLSQIAAVFEATLDLVPPLPALLRQGLERAYSRYHSRRKPDAAARTTPGSQHMVRYHLLPAVQEIITRAGYDGEIARNIDAALRTRIRSLCMGACGRILRGGEDWETTRGKLVDTSILVELESIADTRSRALVMALFVVYYRYAIEDLHRKLTRSRDDAPLLERILVLEEAHRIIGKRSDQDGSASEEYFANMLGEVRQYGCGIIVSDQSPSRLIPAAMSNTNTKIIMRLVAGADIESAVAGAGLPRQAAQDVTSLAPGEALFVTPSERPSVVRIDHPSRAANVSIRPGVKADSAVPVEAWRDRHFREAAATDAVFAYFASFNRDTKLGWYPELRTAIQASLQARFPSVSVNRLKARVERWLDLEVARRIAGAEPARNANAVGTAKLPKTYDDEEALGATKRAKLGSLCEDDVRRGIEFIAVVAAADSVFEAEWTAN